MSLYQEKLLDHYRYPTKKGTLEGSDFSSGEYNPSCGDSIQIEGIIVSGCLKKIRFQGSGCVISQATASILLDESEGKSLTEIQKITHDKLTELIGISLGPTRLKCALLALQALHTGIVMYQTQQAKV